MMLLRNGRTGMKTEQITILERVKSRLRMGWTQQVAARDPMGHVVRFDSPNAVCWCLLGAIVLESNLYKPGMSWDQISGLFVDRVVGVGASCADLNDTANNVDDVLAAVDLVITRLRERKT